VDDQGDVDLEQQAQLPEMIIWPKSTEEERTRGIPKSALSLNQALERVEQPEWWRQTENEKAANDQALETIAKVAQWQGSPKTCMSQSRIGEPEK
jgi:hypothetical protein